MSVVTSVPAFLLKASFGAPRVQHLLRCSPSVEHRDLDKFDGILRGAFSKVANANVSDLQWLQASLPVKDGGLGLRRVSSLALPAFLASTASTTSLQNMILGSSSFPEDGLVERCASLWSAQFGPQPAGMESFKQKS